MPTTPKRLAPPTCNAYLGDGTRCRGPARWFDHRRGLYMCQTHFERLKGNAPSNRTSFRPFRWPNGEH